VKTDVILGNTAATLCVESRRLAAGKGVLIIQDLAEAKEELKTCSYIKIWRSQFKSGY
jgi:phosphoribosylamine-glycine ligase